MAKVEVLVHTFYKKPLKPGDTIEVDEKVAERWERNHIARIVGSHKTVDDLKVIAEANGVDISGLTKKADIIAALQAAGVLV